MTTVNSKTHYKRVPDHIYPHALSIVAKSLRGQTDAHGAWKPFVDGIQYAINHSYQIHGSWPQPVPLDTKLPAAIRLLKLSLEVPFDEKQAYRFLVLARSLIEALNIHDNYNKEYWG